MKLSRSFSLLLVLTGCFVVISGCAAFARAEGSQAVITCNSANYGQGGTFTIDYDASTVTFDGGYGEITRPATINDENISWDWTTNMRCHDRDGNYNHNCAASAIFYRYSGNLDYYHEGRFPPTIRYVCTKRGGKVA